MACTGVVVVVVVVSVMSSMNPLLYSRYTPEALLGPRVSLFPAFMMRFIPINEYSATEMVQPVTIPFYNLCHWVILSQTENHRCTPSRYSGTSPFLHTSFSRIQSFLTSPEHILYTLCDTPFSPGAELALAFFTTS